MRHRLREEMHARSRVGFQLRVAFANEIGALCEETGADAKEVERGLKTDERIGPRAYLGAGGPFAGGTLARDLSFLITRAGQVGVPVPLLEINL